MHDVADGGLQEIINSIEIGVPHAIQLTGDGRVEGLRIDTGRIVALIGVGEVLPRFSENWSGDEPAISIYGAPTAVYLDRVQITGNSLVGGLHVTAGATAYVEDSWVDRNSIGGIRVDGGADLKVSNSLVALNGNFSTQDAIVVEGASLELLYATVAYSPGVSVRCDAASQVTVRNSIMAAYEGSSVQCALSASYSAFDQDVGGTANVEVGAADPDWFEDVFLGDAHLTGVGHAVFAGIADWREGDPTHDIDGDPRPTEDGSYDTPGADVD